MNSVKICCATVVAAAGLVCGVGTAHATDLKGTITSTVTISDDSRLVGDVKFIEDNWINNAAGSNGAACDGVCLSNSNKNVLKKSTFHGNGSVDYMSGNVDFGIGFEASSSENQVVDNDIGGNTNGVEFFNTSSDNAVRHNVITGNPAAQVTKTFTAANQQGADITFRPPLVQI